MNLQENWSMNWQDPFLQQDSWYCASCWTESDNSMIHCCYIQQLDDFQTEEIKQNDVHVQWSCRRIEICYCSQWCQKEHWDKHKRDCVNVQTIRRDQTKLVERFSMFSETGDDEA